VVLLVHSYAVATTQLACSLLLVYPVNAVRDMDVFIDNDLGAALTFGELCHAASLHLTSFVSFTDTSPTTASIPWWCRLCTQDYGNFVLVRLPAYLQRRLQSVLNMVAHLVFRLDRYDHVSDALATLHWLRLPQHVDFKVAVMAFRVLHGLAPPYLNDVVRVTDLPGHH